MTETLNGAETRVENDGLRSLAPGPATVFPAEVPAGAEPTTDWPSVSIVVPYYNPGDRLRVTVERLVRALETTGLSFEIIAVSDGSTDGSAQNLEDLPEHLVRRVSYADNVGKGHALRTGLAMSKGCYVGFIDADGDISPEHLTSFLALMHAEEPDIIVGSKRHAASSVRWTPLRRFYSWSHQILVRTLFQIDIKDTQVGIKLMHRRVANDVLPLLRETRFALDLELLVVAQHLGYTRIVEEPVRIEQRLDSTISVARAWRLLLDTFGLFTRFTIRRRYDAAIEARSGVGAVVGGDPVMITGTTAATSALPAA